VDQYFNDSTGVGDEGETDARGPWNEGGDWEIVESPQMEKGVENLEAFDAADLGTDRKKRSSERESVKTRKRA